MAPEKSELARKDIPDDGRLTQPNREHPDECTSYKNKGYLISKANIFHLLFHQFGVSIHSPSKVKPHLSIRVQRNDCFL